jgi:hypothetical protein
MKTNRIINLILFLFVLVLQKQSIAQYAIGHQTITFNDPSRTGGFGSGGGHEYPYILSNISIMQN